MSYYLVVYNVQGEEVFRKLYTGVSGTFMHEIYRDYKHLGGEGGYADFEPAGTKCIAFPDPKFVNM